MIFNMKFININFHNMHKNNVINEHINIFNIIKVINII